MKKQITKDQYHCMCERCGYDWISRKGIPDVCAKCHSVRWDKKIETAKREAQSVT